MENQLDPERPCDDREICALILGVIELQESASESRSELPLHDVEPIAAEIGSSPV
jgi:hypothetical protein